MSGRVGDRSPERIAAWAEARAAVLLDEYQLIDEDTDELNLEKYLRALRRTVRTEAKDVIEEHDRLRDEG